MSVINGSQGQAMSLNEYIWIFIQAKPGNSTDNIETESFISCIFITIQRIFRLSFISYSGKLFQEYTTSSTLTDKDTRNSGTFSW